MALLFKMLGQTINDRYKILSELGQGGMGTVYRAHDSALDRDVAVKILSNTRLGTEGRARLIHEAQTIAKLNHPNIVTVFDVGEHQHFPFIVMELLEGGTLYENKPAEFDRIVEIARQVCTALEHAHQHQIIHRDLKPENILFDVHGKIRLMDFGLARSVASRLTSDGAIVGTVFYMPPEQAMGASVDARSDLYSLGVILYELSTGSLPFEDPDPIAVISQHIHAPLVPPIAKNGDIPPALNHLIESLLSKEPDDRPESAAVALKMLQDPALLEISPAPFEELSVLERIVRGRMVGRQKEFQEARSLWKKAQKGAGQLLLISGEPGIGKTRLTRETVTHADVSGGRALTGACYTEGGAPYSAFGQIFRQFFLDGKSSVELPDFIMADLLALAPDLQPRFPNVPPNPKLDPQYEQQRIFENVTAFFRILSSEKPLILVIEDVHWADSGTLLLLLHLARNVKTDAIMVIANYREVELDESHPFHQVLLDINREHLATRIKLARLSRQQTSDLLASMFDDETTPEFLEGIYHETEGNPFFIEEVCKALVETGKLYFENGEWHRPSMDELAVPQSIRIAIQARLGKLAEDHHNVLRLAAVFGHEFDFEVLSHASNEYENALIDALEAAEKAQLIRANPKAGPSAFSFVHALIPSTIYEDINTLRRSRMHARAAQAIQAVHPDDYEQLAFHFTGAGDLENAVENYRNAARRAEELFAFDAAIQNLQTALDLLEPGEHHASRLALLEHIGAVRSDFGEKNDAIACFRAGLELIPSLGGEGDIDRIRLHRKIIETGISISWFEDFQRVQDQYERSIAEGLALIEDSLPHAEVVLFLVALSTHSWRRKAPQDYEAAEKYAQRAIEIAESMHVPALVSSAMGALSAALDGAGEYRQIIEVCAQRLALIDSEKITDPKQIIDAHYNMGAFYGLAGDYSEAIPHLQKASQFAADIQAIEPQTYSKVMEAAAWFQLDQWDQVLAIEAERRELERRFPNFAERAFTMCFQIGLAAAVHALRGDLNTAAALREESNQIMIRHEGPSERWNLNNYT